jgi:radical SAM protein with 4Fe4S-binding SPASM domain
MLNQQWHKGRPFSMSFEPTTACNLGCPECPSGLRSFTRPTGKMDPAFFRNTLDQVADTLMYGIFYFQGEPYLHPQFTEIVEYAASKKIYTITSTNAHFLDDEHAKKTVESGLDRLIISLDGTTQKVYESYRRNGQMEKVIEGAHRIVEWKKKLNSKKPYVLFQFLVVRPNEDQMEDVKKLAREIGVNGVLFKSAQLYDYKNGNELMPLNPKYSRYKQLSDGTFEIKNKLDNYCWKMWHSNVITWDGKVIPCCFDKDAKYPMGDLQEQKFDMIWNGEPYENFRLALSRHRKNIDICKNCTEGTRVWL